MRSASSAQIGDPQMRPDPGVHLLHIVGALRFLDIVIRAGLEAGDLVLDLSQGGQHEDRRGAQLSVFLDFHAEPGAIQLGHLIIGEDELGTWLLAGLGQSLGTVIGRLDVIALFPEHHREHAPHRGTVFD